MQNIEYSGMWAFTFCDKLINILRIIFLNNKFIY